MPSLGMGTTQTTQISSIGSILNLISIHLQDLQLEAI